MSEFEYPRPRTNSPVVIKDNHYIVEEGDTIQEIAVKFGVGLNTLKRLNQIYFTEVYVGQIIKLRQSTYTKPVEEKDLTSDEDLVIVSMHGTSIGVVIDEESSNGESELSCRNHKLSVSPSIDDIRAHNAIATNIDVDLKHSKTWSSYITSYLRFSEPTPLVDSYFLSSSSNSYDILKDDEAFELASETESNVSLHFDEEDPVPINVVRDEHDCMCVSSVPSPIEALP